MDLARAFDAQYLGHASHILALQAARGPKSSKDGNLQRVDHVDTVVHLGLLHGADRWRVQLQKQSRTFVSLFDSSQFWIAHHSAASPFVPDCEETCQTQVLQHELEKQEQEAEDFGQEGCLVCCRRCP